MLNVGFKPGRNITIFKMRKKLHFYPNTIIWSYFYSFFYDGNLDFLERYNSSYLLHKTCYLYMKHILSGWDTHLSYWQQSLLYNVIGGRGHLKNHRKKEFRQFIPKFKTDMQLFIRKLGRYNSKLSRDILSVG